MHIKFECSRLVPGNFPKCIHSTEAQTNEQEEIHIVDAINPQFAKALAVLVSKGKFPRLIPSTSSWRSFQVTCSRVYCMAVFISEWIRHDLYRAVRLLCVGGSGVVGFEYGNERVEVGFCDVAVFVGDRYRKMASGFVWLYLFSNRFVRQLVLKYYWRDFLILY